MPFLFENVAYKWLEAALDSGIPEREYWGMTIAELIRAMESRKRQYIAAEKERAAHNYILADLIGRSISRLYSSSAKMPTIAEVYPSLFSQDEVKEKQQEKLTELSILRLKQFANAFNNKNKGVSAKQ